MRIFAILTACAALAATPALAENWKNVTTLADGTKLAADVDSVANGNGYASIDVAYAFATPRNGVKVVKDRLFFSCITATFDTIKRTNYDSAGRVIGGFEKKQMSELQMVRINNGSPAEFFGQIVCNIR
jgi:hypothetical protein